MIAQRRRSTVRLVRLDESHQDEVPTWLISQNRTYVRVVHMTYMQMDEEEKAQPVDIGLS